MQNTPEARNTSKAVEKVSLLSFSRYFFPFSSCLWHQKPTHFLFVLGCIVILLDGEKKVLGPFLSKDRGLRFQIEAYLKALQCIQGPSIIRRGSNGVRIDTLYKKHSF